MKRGAPGRSAGRRQTWSHSRRSVQTTLQGATDIGANRQPVARQRAIKPRVSAFTSADIPKLLDLRPDLLLSFSDLQADIVPTLIRQGVAVHAFNQRTI